MKSTTVATMLGVAVVMAAVDVDADAIEPPPKDCPSGTEGSSCHGGPFCDPQTCVNDSKCKNGNTCQDVQYCVKQINCAGGWGGNPSYRDAVKGLCGANNKCASGSCQALRVCAPPGGVGGDGQGGPVERGCTCATAGAGTAGLAAWIMLGLALLVRRRGRN